MTDHIAIPIRGPVTDAMRRRIAELEPWSHYFKFDNSTYTGYSMEIIERYKRTYCVSGDPPELIAEFEEMYNKHIVRYDRFLTPCHVVRKLLGGMERSWTVVDLACNDGMKSMYMSRLGIENVMVWSLEEIASTERNL